ncbi:hypothetical protein [Paraburkholderia aromaticivorans]|uniref:hypothetical protein n=1 Tax=Paraburkholderia aromaticivorans TaxID=2026199 RepID=UPI0014560A9C|nr:hypothetical protein [Paraburkholderia aromaticivorans]
MKTTIALLLTVATLAGCAGSPLETRLTMAKSRDAYKACLMAKAGPCDAEREAYSADREAAGLSPMMAPRPVVVVQ